MSWVNLATVGWGSSPTINCNFQYDRRRNGSAMEYQIWLGINSDRRSLHFGYPIYADIWVNGSKVATTTIKNASPSTFSDRLEYYSSWISVANKTSGTTSLKIRLYSGSGSTRDTSYSYTMAVDPAGSDLTVSDGTLGVQQTLTITQKNTAFRDTLTWQCGRNHTGTIAELTADSYHHFTPPMDLATEALEATTIQIIYTLTTYDCSIVPTGTLVESKQYAKTLTIPASVIPSASVAVSDGTENYARYGAYVQSHSTLHVVTTPTLAYNSPINSYSVSADGIIYTSSDFTTPAVQGSGTLTVSAKVTDKRGRTSNAATASVNVLAYAQPYVTTGTIRRCDQDGTPNEEGHYMSVSFTGSITPLNNVNTAVWAIRYRVAGTTTWTDVPLSSLDGNYTPTHQEIIRAADASAFEVQVTGTDDFGTVVCLTGSIPVAYAIMNWRADGDGMAIGGINTQAGLQVYMDTEFTGDVTMNPPLGIASGGTGGITEYTDHESGSLTSLLDRTKTFTVTGDGAVFISGSLSARPNTWGTTRVVLMLNGNVIAQDSDTTRNEYANIAEHANASIFVKVSDGDVIQANYYSTRYTSGNTYDIYYNALALGCTLGVS